jgi:hypothetical protein
MIVVLVPLMKHLGAVPAAPLSKKFKGLLQLCLLTSLLKISKFKYENEAVKNMVGDCYGW